ncbi:DUF2959 domain-containing protein [Oceanospirillum linum]|uniref:DNA repair protein n=1 Tax=Oceanospirillum linum TaxID=966 RepID=A0A1T1HAU0_OCELI|nr:DUF2959 domain-containing protein [Oceanospirillum linum]OOV86847.1 DNA repair protein [Oceanospirillum linum]SEG20889.1 Protein of unknown function [Oleiphilus messinensis]SMP24783.1 Protein of unknown function [Oceanospirillum linum]
MKITSVVCRLLCLMGTVSLLSACQSTYYSAMEQVGVHKRDILVDRVDNAKESQEEAQEQFKSALDQYRAVVSFNGGEIETLYERLNAEYEDSEAAAEEVRERIEKVEHVAEALFDEWEEELNLYTSSRLRRQSERQLNETQSRYKSLIRAMKRAEGRMQPVLSALQDNVLFLKHNLNARAIGALKDELAGIRQDVDVMIREMSVAIQESDQFIADMKQE